MLAKWIRTFAVLIVCTSAVACAASKAGEAGNDILDSGAAGDVDSAITSPDASPSTVDATPQGSADAAAAGFIYVSTGGNDANSGTIPSKPVKAIAVAITRAASCVPTPCKVWIAAGTYHQQIALSTGVDLFGGYAAGFATRDTSLYKVTITSDQPRTVVADGLTNATTLDGLTIEGASYQSSSDGRSTYALYVRDSADHLTVRDTSIIAGWAAAGAVGAAGELTTCAALGGQGGTAFDCGGGGGAAGSAAGDPTSGGGGGGTGGSNCPSACPLIGGDGVSGGHVGSPGDPGVVGDNGDRAIDDDGSFASGLWSGAAGSGGKRGSHGTGGGGGGSGGSKKFVACFGCGTLLGGRGGDGAPGGCGGGGGEAGEPGGSSFGMVVIASTVAISNVNITGGVGGRGGNGGDGHVGAPGGTDVDDGKQGAGSQRCGLIDYRSGAGANGGIGGKGGHGGGGAGGVGGVSVGVALVGGGAVSELEPGALGIQLGVPGDGGSGGAGNTSAPSGLSGLAATTVTY